VIVRVLAILLTLGVVAGSVEARADVTPSTAALSISLAESDDLAEIELALPTPELVDDTSATPTLVTSDSPPHYEPCWFVFRPPRTYAFN
jgi:hypothetical protein